MLGVFFCRQKLKPRPTTDLTLGIGLEVWQILWQIILLNLFWYSVTVISPITCHTLTVVGLYGSASNPYLLKRFSLNLDSSSSAFSSWSNFWLREFLNSSWQTWWLRLCWIRLDLLLLGGSIPFHFFPSMFLSLGFGAQVIGARICWLTGFLAIF